MTAEIPGIPTPISPSIISVTELNRLARMALEKSLPSCWVAGELSNLTRASSGHWYFTLKDSQASVRCAMFRARNQFVDWNPREGEQVEIRAQPTLYEARGEYQLVVDAMRHAGQGRLFEAFLRLKERLDKEGLFAPERKRALPAMPRHIGVITSPQGAALHDVLTTLNKRWPLARITLYPTQVQGANAAGQVANAIRLADEQATCDLLLLVRGGGSLEDLWAFNEEVVARAIAACNLPLVSGVGHETDFSIADFVADLRAPTPTGAAQLATPDQVELRQHIQQLAGRLTKTYTHAINQHAQRLDGLFRRLRHPADRLAKQRQMLLQLGQRLAYVFRSHCAGLGMHSNALAHRLASARPQCGPRREHVTQLMTRARSSLTTGLLHRQARLDSLRGNLHHLNPAAVLERGYSIVRDQTGKVIRQAVELAPGQEVTVDLARGGFGANVTDIRDE